MARVGIFGGSFDPIHPGHLAVAHAALKQLDLERVIFVPAATSPFKAGAVPRADSTHRLAMIELVVKNIPQFSVSSRELEQGGISYTVDTIRYLMKEIPGSEFFLIMGQDAYDGFDRWKESALIRQWVKIVVAPRHSYLASACSEKEGFQKGVVYLSMPLYDDSSTQLRLRGADRGIVDSGMIQDVQDYILKHGLYRQERE